MKLLQLLRERRLEGLRVQKATVEAVLARYEDIGRRSGWFYPATEAENARMLASINHRIAALEKRLSAQ